jgi:membrane protease YdiL (CAAX protease family)
VPAPEGIPTRQLVVLNTTIPVVAFLVLAVGDALVRPRVGQQLGGDRSRMRAGVLAGITGLVLALPLVCASMALTDWAFRRIGYQHPSEHELLRAMGDTPDAWVKYLAILVAVLVAPLWEELLFRGHIQTLVRESLVRAGEPRDPAAMLDTAPAPARPHPLQAWLAILLTSFVFASVHPVWTIPPIFVLSICLGLAYERTNNLWVPIIMHSGFNSVMTAYFLLH